MSEPQYEFNEAQNQVIFGLAHKIKFVSLFLIVIGLMQVVYGVLTFLNWAGLIEQISSGIIYLLLGIWGTNAASSFQKVVDTQGNDIDHLMNALGDLKNAVGLAYWLLIIFLAVLIVSFILGIFLGGGAPPPEVVNGPAA